MLQKPEPVLIAGRFQPLLEALLELLESLDEADWQRPVHQSGEWTVKDLAQHLLGDEIGILSGKRDRYAGEAGPPETWEGLVGWIDRRNALWVEATRRMSPRLLCELLRVTGEAANAFFLTLDPFAAGVPVHWAGPEPAPVWLDLAREFTERWHHQQHIRLATGRPGCTGPEYLAPVLATFVHALPVTYREVQAPEGTAVLLHIPGEAGGEWTVLREGERWELYRGSPEQPAAQVELEAENAWRLFTRGLSPGEARARAKLSGDAALAAKALETVSILA